MAQSDTVAKALRQSLNHSVFVLSWSDSDDEFMNWVVSNRHRIDCLVIEINQQPNQVLRQLNQRDILLPAVLVSGQSEFNQSLTEGNKFDPSASEGAKSKQPFPVPMSLGYHDAIINIGLDRLASLEDDIREAIDRFLKLPTQSETTELVQESAKQDEEDNHLFLLSLQQQRLAEKLQERLGYLGVYYKRNSQNFFRNMTLEERHEFVDKLRQDYRNIILNYFANDNTLNQRIDDFVNLTFFADVSVSKVVEIHMELMDDFSKQLHLEGRSEEMLLDYRLTLIDVVAHLCEMYRRSIPREL